MMFFHNMNKIAVSVELLGITSSMNYTKGGGNDRTRICNLLLVRQMR